MKGIDNLVFVFCFAILQVPVVAQMGLTYPYFLTSENGAYFLKSIPHSSQAYDEIGRTEVYRTVDSSLIYKMDRYIYPKGLLLSNDGSGILYVRDHLIHRELEEKAAVTFFMDGRLSQEYYYRDLLEVQEDYFYQPFFYLDRSRFEISYPEMDLKEDVPGHIRIVDEEPIWSNNSHGYLALYDHTILRIDLELGTIIDRRKFKDAQALIIESFTKRNAYKPDVKFPGTYRLPKLSNGSTIEAAITDKFDYTYDGFVGKELYRYYKLEVSALINSEGECLELKAAFEDTLAEVDISEFLAAQQYDPEAVPDIYEKWHFQYSFSLRKSDLLIAAQERLIKNEEDRLHRLWRIQQDTLDGVYIPKDIEDCMSELDRLVSDSREKSIKQQGLNSEHFGLGLYIRNNWGLWSSSRLKIYMESFGLVHPDDMSGVILECYYAHLRGKPIDFEKRVSRYPGQKTVPRKLMPPSEIKFPFQE